METPKGHEQNADQIAYWNGPGGERWARRQQVQDVLLAPIADILIDRAKPKTGERIVDVGCGSGATTMAFARKVGASGHVLGVDVSGPMLEQALAGAPADAPVDFVQADATVYPFEPASVDLVASRFGVMFFADPAKSFSNLHGALRRSGRLAFICWREPRENPWMMAPLQAVYKHAPNAAAGIGRSRTVLVCVGGAGASHSGQRGIHADRNGAVRSGTRHRGRRRA